MLAKSRAALTELCYLPGILRPRSQARASPAIPASPPLANMSGSIGDDRGGDRGTVPPLALCARDGRRETGGHVTTLDEEPAPSSDPVPDHVAKPVHPPPGTTRRRRFHVTIDYELVSCGFHGHELVGTGAAELRPLDAYAVREAEEEDWRWYRCLRCDSWVRLRRPERPSSQFPPDPATIRMPVKGKRLRDRYVLRLIVIDRGFHFLVLGALAVVIFIFAQHRSLLHHDYVKVLTALQEAPVARRAATRSSCGT